MHTGHIMTIIVNMRPVCHAQLLAMNQLTLCNFVEGKLFASAHLNFTSSYLDISETICDAKVKEQRTFK